VFCGWQKKKMAQTGEPRSNMTVISIGRRKTKSQTRKKRGTGPGKRVWEKSNDVRKEKPAANSTAVTAKDAREEVNGLIRKEAGAMTRAIIVAVKEGQQFGQVKYLFEVGGIYPAQAGDNPCESNREESVTERLLRELDEQKEAAMDRSGQRAAHEIAKDEDAIE
jgi:hypothetical protein